MRVLREQLSRLNNFPQAQRTLQNYTHSARTRTQLTEAAEMMPSTADDKKHEANK